MRCQSKLNSVRVKWLHTHWLSFGHEGLSLLGFEQERVFMWINDQRLCVLPWAHAHSHPDAQTHAHFIPLDIQKSIKQMLRLADHLFTQYSHDDVWTQQQSPSRTFPHTHLSYGERSAWREGDMQYWRWCFGWMCLFRQPHMDTGG